MALKYWGKIISDYSAMRWPCPEWFHVPLSSELEALCEVVTTDLWLDSDGITMGTYLKMPIAGCRTTDSSIKNVGMYAYYWTATAHSVDNVEYIIFSSDSLFYHDWAYRASAFSIRWFRDSPVIPDNSWTTLYDWSSVQNGAWIFWNPSSWLISASSDWQNWITIQDKNLWATAVYNYWDTLSEANCGKFYQWGNNYWFPRTWTVTTSATQVDASNYWPWNYYSSDTFITRSVSLYDWSSVQNDDLWWWVTWVQQSPADIVERYYWGKTISDYSAMRWPCPEGFHVPKSSERSAVINAWVSLWARTTSWTTSVTNFRTYLKLPNIVYLFPGNWLPWTWWTPQHRYYWWCRQTWNDWSWRYCDALDVVEDYWWSIWVENTSSNHWCPVRPFKDKPVIPDSTWTTLYTSDVYPASRNIKHSQSLWLITISYDWTYITIADKNAGATSVYNFWDTITSANWWWLYQWWNNYPFSINWATTTSSTRVDTTWYGPWNYYSGSTFITGGVNDDWFSPRNRNLWWWITWIQQKPVKVTEVYYNTTKIWPFYPAWIYWNPSIDWWVISLSNNWTDWLTIADKNLWATQAFHPWDTYSQANCWNFYQWWNNYWFPYSWTPSRSTTKVNVSSYWPGNYYSNSTFRRVDRQWERWTSTNFNLWWWTTWTDEARRWPCPEWRHIPRKTELAAVKALTGYGSLEWKILLPKWGIRDNYSAAVTDSWSLSAIWNSDLEMGTYSYVYNLEWTWGEAYYMPAFGCNIRPFRNEAIMPTDEWTKLL